VLYITGAGGFAISTGGEGFSGRKKSGFQKLKIRDSLIDFFLFFIYLLIKQESFQKMRFTILKLVRPNFFIFLWLMLAGLMFAVSALAETPAASGTFFPQTRYEFAPVFEDQEVTCGFVVQNKGKAPLDILEVKTD